jgi:hypothetical protein
MHRQRERVGTSLCGPVVALCLMILGLWDPSQAAEFACGAGDVACLINTINAANANGTANTITLAAGTYTLTAMDNTTDGPTGLPSITGRLTITGTGADTTIIERAAGAPPFRLLHVASTGTLALDGLTLQGGNLAGLADGGGVLNRGTLTVTHSLLRGHAASSGGGILSYETLAILHSTVSGNTVSGSGGGIFLRNPSSSVPPIISLTLTNSTVTGNTASVGGGIGSFIADLTITNSTVSGNAASTGGGIAVGPVSVLTLTNSTVTGNTASVDGGIGIFSGGFGPPSAGRATLRNTILARNTVPPTGTGPDCSSMLVSQGHNLFGDPTGCNITFAAGDLTGDPGLSAFTDTGMPGQGYIPLLPTSSAIDAGENVACPSTDQLGQPRIGSCDIGAIEFQPSDMVSIRQAIFVDQLSVIFVVATSSAAPEAELFVTVPGCLTEAPMLRIVNRYLFLRDVHACGDLDDHTVTVTSNHGGSASAPLR